MLASCRCRPATCRLHGIAVTTYLIEVLQRVEQHTASRVAELKSTLCKQHFAEQPLRSDLHGMARRQERRRLTAYAARSGLARSGETSNAEQDHAAYAGTTRGCARTPALALTSIMSLRRRTGRSRLVPPGRPCRLSCRGGGSACRRCCSDWRCDLVRDQLAIDATAGDAAAGGALALDAGDTVAAIGLGQGFTAFDRIAREAFGIEAHARRLRACADCPRFAQARRYVGPLWGHPAGSHVA